MRNGIGCDGCNYEMMIEDFRKEVKEVEKLIRYSKKNGFNRVLSDLYIRLEKLEEYIWECEFIVENKGKFIVEEKLEWRM
jgi:hypothetical protein